MVYRLALTLLLSLGGVGYATPAVARQKIDPPRKIKNVDPVYPAAAQRARVHGDVVIKATIGPDGKVSDATVVTSIPLLDDAAVAAVRQWEYSPTVVEGVPVAVSMTVTVHFSLQESAAPAAASSGPLVLDRDGTDWTVRGTPLLDDDLRFWLHDVMRTEPSKEICYHASPGSTVAEVVDVLTQATAAGVERMRVFVGDAAPADAVRVYLEPVSQKPVGITLPVSDVGSAVRTTAVPLSIARSGTTAAASASVQRAAAGAVLRLRIDRTRKMSDVWEVLKIGTARQVDGFALGVQLPAGATAAVNAPVSAQQQAEWKKLEKAVFDLVFSDKKTFDEGIADSIPLLEKFVARNPNVMEAQYKLAVSYSGRATRSGATPESKRQDWGKAVRHFRVAADFFPSEQARFLMTLELAQLYAPDKLDDKPQAERYARRLVDENPTESMSHMYYARMLYEAGDVAGAVNALRHGRTVSTMPLVGLVQSVQYLTEYVHGTPDLPRDRAKTLLDELTAVSDAILADTERGDEDSRLAVMGKTMALDLQAEHLADTSAERVRLLLESDRWFDTLTNGKLGVPGPARQVSASEAVELECNALSRWSSVAADGKPPSVAIPAVQRYVSMRPSCASPHAKMAELLTSRAHENSDTAARAADLQHAIDELLQVIDLAPTAYERSQAFEQVVALSGPKELNRPQLVDAAARTLLKRSPDDPSAHYMVAALLFRTGRSGDGEKALRTARSAIKATPSNRAAMAHELIRTVRNGDDLPPAAARRLFDEAGALVTDAEKMKGGKDDRDVISARIAWLKMSAEQFEKDPARAAAQREQAKQLAERLKAMQSGSTTQLHNDQ